MSEHTPSQFAGYPQVPPGYSGRHDRADKRAFYAWLAPIAQDVQRRTGIPASITLAQGFRESKSGVYAGYSELMSTYRNLYGMKAGGCTKKLAVGSVNLTTNEYQNGVLTPEPGSFAVYRNAYESTLQHALLFYCARVYAPALAWRSNPYQFLIHIAPYYAPGPAGHYSVPLWADVKAYNLEQYDVPAREWALDPRYVPAAHVASWQGAIGA